MIKNISSYAETIICLTIAVTIIELILPNSKSKKYVMFTSSLMIMLAVINPIISVINSEFDISKKVSEIQADMQHVEYIASDNYDLEYNIYNTYIKNIENNMKSRLEEIGYEVLESKIIVNKDNYEPENIEMEIKHKDGFIQPIIIDVFSDNSKNDIYEADINKIKTLLSSEYGVKKEKIIINRK